MVPGKSWAFSTRYAVTAPSAPVGSTSFCTSGTPGAYTNQAGTSNCSASSSNTNTITWQWAYDGTNISGASGTFTVGSSTPAAVTLTATQSAVLSTLSVGTHSLTCKYTPNKSNCTNVNGTAVVSPALVFTVLTTPAAIGGTASVCAGITTTLTNSVVGGTWSTTAGTGSVTVNSSTGVVTGGAVGTATVTYSTGCGTAATKVVTVSGSPAALTGTFVLCAGGTSSLSSATSGGTWASGTTTVATVNSSGVVSAVAAGTSSISYTVSGCPAIATVTVNSVPATPTVSATSATVCLGNSATFTGGVTPAAVTLLNQNFNTSLTDAISGTWTVANTGTASAYNWAITNSGGWSDITGLTGDGTKFIGTNADLAGSGVNLITSLQSPVFSTVGYSTATVTFNQYCYSSSTYDLAAELDYSIDGGTTWTLLSNYYNTTSGATTWTAASPNQTITLPAACIGQANVKLRWYYNSTYGFYWAVDNIVLKATPTVTYAWTGVSGASGMGCTACTTNTITPTATGANVYNITGTVNGCASAAATVTVNVNPVPAPITGAMSACVSTTSSLSDATTGGTWASSATGIATINSSGVVTAGSTAGTTTITYTASGCYVTSTFAVNGSPAAITGTATVCTGANTTLANPGGVGAWTSSNTGVATVGASTGVVTGVLAGTATISYSNGCGTPSAKDVTVNTTPAAIAGAGTACIGSNTTLSSSPAGGTWSSSTTATATIGASTGILVPVASGTTTISYTLGNGCTAATATETVNVAPSAVSVSPAGTYTVCLGGSVTPTASATYSGTTILLSQNFNSGLTGATGGTWTVVNTGASSSYNWAITAPSSWSDVTITGDGSNFIGTNADLAGSGVNLNTSVVSPVFSTVGYTSATLTYNHYCKSSSTYDLNAELDYSIDGGTTWTLLTNYYNTTAGATSWAVATPNQTTALPAACIGQANVKLRWYFNSTYGYYWAVDNIVLKASPSLTYAWTGISGASGLSCTSCTAPTITPAATGANVYSVTATAGGCSTTNGVTVNVNATPTAAPTNTSPVCSGSSVSLSANPGGGATTYSWSGPNLSSTTAANPTATPTTTSTYSLTVTNGTASPGCSPATIYTTIVTVNALPATTTASGGGTYCGSATITAAGGSGGTIYFQGTVSGGTSTATASSSQVVTSSGTYYFRSLSPAGCWGPEGSVAVVINPLPATPVVSGGGIFGGSTTITASNGGDGTMYFQGTTSGGTSTATPSSSQVVSASGVYYFRAQSAAGCWSNQGSTAVTVNPLPATVVVSGSGVYCGSATLTASNGGDGTIYFQGTTSGGTSTATPSTSQVVTSSGIYYFRAQNAGGYWGAEGSATVVINSVPASATVSGGGTFCGGTTITASNGGDGTMYFQGTTPGGTSTATPSASQSITSSGTYYFRAQNASGCWGAQGSVAVVINAVPSAAPSGNGPICLGGTVTLHANPGTNTSVYTWSGSALATTTSQNPTATPTSTTVYSLTVSDGSGNPGCSPATVYTTSVTVNATPVAAPSNSGTICAGGTVSLSANPSGGAVSYSWSGPALSSSTVQNPTATPSSSAVYSLTVSDGTANPGCSPTTVYTTSVTVNTTPTAAPANSGPICNGGIVALTANPAGGATLYSWSGPNLSSATDQNPTATPTATSVYSLTVSNASGLPGCSPVTIYTTTVSVDATPAAAPVSTSTICNGGTATLTANPAGSTSAYVWSGANLSSSTAQNPTATPTATSVYSLHVTNSTTNSGCASDYTVTVNVNATPVAAPANNGYICNGGVVSLTANPSGGATVYSWSGANLSSSTTQNPTATPAATSVYTLTVSDGSGNPGCAPSMAYTTSVTVNAKPTAAPANDGYICVGGTVNLTANPSGGATVYNWAGAALSSTSAQNPTAAPTATSVYSLTVSDGSSQPGCAPTTIYTMSVTVNGAPSIDNAGNDGPICVGSTLHLSVVNPVNVAHYAWSGPVSVTGAATAAPTVPSATTAATGVYTVAVDNGTGSGCAATYTTSAIVNAIPTVSAISLSSAKLCPGAMLALTAGSVSGTGTVSSYNWSGPSGFTTTTATNTTTVAVGGAAQAGVYSLSVTYPGVGCTSGQVASPVVTVNALPTIGMLSATPGVLCGGADLALAAGGASGTGSLISYNWSGPYGYSSTTGTPAQTYTVPNDTASGVYSVTVTYEGTGCTSTAAVSSAVTVNALPTRFNITGGGAYCSGGSGVSIGLSGSDTGAKKYQLYIGTTASGAARVGSGYAIDFGVKTAAGTYFVVAHDTATGCTDTMLGTTIVTISPVPSTYTITGGGSYCVGGTGVLVGLNGSDASVSYQLYNGTATAGSMVVGTGSAISFGLQTDAGNYTVIANPSAACARSMTGSVNVVVNPLPVAYNVTGGGAYCSGGTGVRIGLDYGITGINYQLYRGATAVGGVVAGATMPLDFGLITTAGTYSVVATNPSTGCNNAMVGTATVSVNTTPATFTVSGGGAFCFGGTGVDVSMSGSATGVNYQLYNGATALGAAVPGSGSAIDFGFVTNGGTYTVRGTDAINGCTTVMTGSAAVTVNPQPAAFAVSGGGTFCAGGAGFHILLSNSASGINYQLFNGTTAVGSAVAGTGSSLDFGTQTAAGTYSVVATNTTTGCTNTMSGTATINVNAQPTSYAVTGGGNYCSGGAGVHIGLAFSATGVNYQLYNGATAVGSPVGGSNTALDFGFVTGAGTYTVLATNTSTGCTNAMSGTASVIVNSLPTAYAVSGGGTYCAGGAGFAIALANSVTGVSYQLYNGASTVGSPVAGTGSGISFGLQTSAGTYTVLATNTTTGCTSSMTGSAVINVNAAPGAFTVTGGGTACSGSGVAVGLSGSASGINYQLYNGAAASGSAVAGTGAPITFGSQVAPGTYTVLATNSSTSCTVAMSGNAVVIINALPAQYTVTGGGNYCTGGSGVHVGLAFSDNGVNYQLYNGATTIGSAVAGTTASLDFGLQTSAGTYTVLATNTTTGCSRTMSGSATVGINTSPTVFTMTGGGSYCSGGTGVAVGLNSSTSGISYQLYSGATAVGSAVTGTGSAISFGSITAAGTYTAVATNTTTSCSSNMGGSATVTVNVLPTAYTVVGGGTYCSGGTGYTIGLNGSATGVNYQLYNGTTATGAVVAGTGAAISFGTQTAAGTYTVLATNTTTSCTNAMSGSSIIVVNTLPTAYTVTGGGNYCVGGSGVAVGLSGSTAGINYQLYKGSSAVGAPVSGTGGVLSFGLQAGVGTYSVQATNGVTGCVNNMTGTVSVGVNALPTAFAVSGGGAYCSGGSGVHIGMSASVTGVNYQLYSGSATVGSPMAGTGSALDFGLFTAVGTYTVLATDATTGCTNAMSGSAGVSVNPLPAAYLMTGGGAYCTGGTGVHVGLAGSTSGINYQLYYGSTVSGSAVAGTGSALDFGSFTGSGSYSVLATNPITGCSNAMSTTVSVSINALPSAFAMTGGGGYCAGGMGVAVGLSGSASGISYQLYNGSSAVGSAVAGTGSALSFGLKTTAGTYSVIATNNSTLCTANMTGTSIVSINPLPTTYTVTGGGNYCTGGTGVHVGLSGSATGISYQLYLGSTATGSAVAGTGSALDFGTFTTSGTYSVAAVNTTTSCSSNMSGTTVISTNPLPVAYAVTGGGAYCTGGSGMHIGLANSATGINYQLYNGATLVGSAMAGTNAALDFGFVTAAGTYTVKATDASTGCTANMTGSAAITINPLPVAFALSGGGGYCSGGSGVSGILTGSASGISYQLYNGTTAVGSAVSGTGSSLTFGPLTTAGTYTVLATNTSTSCVAPMTGSISVVVNPLPTAYAVTGGGAYCAGGAGLHVGLASSSVGVNYQLYNGSSTVGTAMAGTGSSLDFGLQMAAGTYSVAAINASTSCTAGMTGTIGVTVNALPATYAVTGGGSYCAGGTGVSVALSGSQSGINYTLYNGSIPLGVVAGTGSAISFGAQTAVGTYTVSATNAATGCVSGMSGNTLVSVNALPTAFIVGGGGSYCAGGAGVHVGLGGSSTGVNYQLYNGATPVGSPVAGTGSVLDFGALLAAGTYSVAASNATTGCASNMSGTASVVVNPLPVAYAVGGGGSYCAGGAGVHVTLSGSASGINYQLYRGGTAIGSAMAGSGSVLDFGLVTVAGTYSVSATNNITGCGSNMTGTTTVSVNALPAAFNVTGGGSYCAGGAGVHVGLSGSATGINYQLYNGSSVVGTAVGGTGAVLDFGSITTAGTYTVFATDATTSCTANMTGSVSVTINALPVVYYMTGGGGYCSGGSGVHVGLSGSATGISYQLYNGALAVGSVVAGTGSALDFGMFTTAGSYSVVATGNSTSCASNMSGISTVLVNTLPAAFTVTNGGSYCSGGAGVHVGLNGSATGISYQLYNGSIASGSAIAGTGTALDFGLQTSGGTYSVMATNVLTACTNAMSGSVPVIVNPLPVAYNVTGGGGYCNGGSGVHVGLNGSESGITYQLYRGSTAIGLLNGTGAAIDFGLQTVAGTYSVLATNGGTGCANGMTGSTSVSINPLPGIFAVTGGGTNCTGGTGFHVGLSGSETGVNYQLYNGSVTVGSAVAGTGSVLDFGIQSAAGTYSVVATNAVTACMRNMSGSVAVNYTALPVVYAVTGGGNYCAGGSGVHVSLAGSEAGFSYQLYRGAALVTTITGTGSGVDFGTQTVAGTYSVVAVNTATTCTSNMFGSVNVGINNLPAVFATNGGGSYCNGGAGVHVGLMGSETNVNYQLFNGATAAALPMAGTGIALDFGLFTTAGSYSVVATNAITGCVSNMSGSSPVSINPLPAVYSITGGGSYCVGGTGVHVGLAGSASGINYQLYNGTTPVATMAGTGSPIDFGLQTNTGTYSIVATNTATTCTSNMYGITTINTNAVPVAYELISYGSAYCAGSTGVQIKLNGSSTGVTYQLYNGTSPIGIPFAGTGAVLDFGLRLAGNYTIVGSDVLTGCKTTMTGNANIIANPLPVARAVTGGGSYCPGGSGVHVGLATSDIGTRYQLYNDAGAVGSPIAGTSDPIDFGLQTAAGTYSVVGSNIGTGCIRNMSNTVTVSINSLPVAFAVTGGGSYCEGGTGVAVNISGSTPGVSYQLYNGSTPIGSAVPGTGSGLSFGSQVAAGTYSVSATDASTSCANMMMGSATVVVNALPAIQSVTGGGNYCSGGAGVHVGLSLSQTGITYQLYINGSATGSAFAGSGSPLDFGLHADPGIYTIVANNDITSCPRNMAGSVAVSVNPLPAVYTVTGGGNYCAGGSGVHVGLGNSQSGINYQLYNGASLSGSIAAGTGAAIDFGLRTATGAYTVAGTNALTGCTSNMTGSATIGTNPIVAAGVTVAASTGDTICYGVPVLYSATAVNGGSAPAYKWYVNNTDMGVTSSVYNYIPMNGDVISVKLTSNAACAAPATATDSVKMVVNPNRLPAVTVSVGPNDTVCLGNTATFMASPAFGGTAPSYTWYKNGISVGTGISYSYMPADGDMVTCHMISNFTCRLETEVASSIITMTVDSPKAPIVNIVANPGTSIAPGQTVSFTAVVSNGGQAPSYQWYVNSAMILGATNATYTVANLANNDSVTCMVTANGPCGGIPAFNTVIMTVGNVGVAQVPVNDMNVILAPNPNNGSFMVKGTMDKAITEISIEVTDLIGQVVHTEMAKVRNGKLNEQVVLNSTLASGMYMVTLRSSSGSKVFHMVIEQ